MSGRVGVQDFDYKRERYRLEDTGVEGMDLKNGIGGTRFVCFRIGISSRLLWK
jgi:hypothetical protein